MDKIRVKWIGIDFGNSLTNSSSERTYWMIGDISKELGEPDLVQERCHRWRAMKEKYGSYNTIKESYRPEAIKYVFHNNKQAAEIFIKAEMKYLKLADNSLNTLKYFKDMGIEVSIVTELKETILPLEDDLVLPFLRHHNAQYYFTDIITPKGKINISTGDFDSRYLGKSKEAGDIYDVLVEDLYKKNIKPSEAVMVGDTPWSDITPAKQRGFSTILYTGYIDRGPCESDFVIDDFTKLKSHIIPVVKNIIHFNT